MSQDERLRQAERRLALGMPDERREDRIIGLAALASVLSIFGKNRLVLLEQEALKHQSPETDRRLSGTYYFSRIDGRELPFSVGSWLHDQYPYTRVADTHVGDLWVSTVWLGIDHSFNRQPHEPRIIFETLVFPKGEWAELAGTRYATEAEAHEGHKQFIEQIKSGEIRHAG